MVARGWGGDYKVVQAEACLKACGSKAEACRVWTAWTCWIEDVDGGMDGDIRAGTRGWVRMPERLMWDMGYGGYGILQCSAYV